MLLDDEAEVIGVRSACPACNGAGECQSCQGTGQIAAQAGSAAARPTSPIHKLLRLRPGAAPHRLCSSQRFGGGTLIDFLTALILVTPLVAIPISAPASHWSWLMLLCVPAAYFVSVHRREFERQEWLARDLESGAAAAGARQNGFADIPQAVPALDDAQFLYRGIVVQSVLNGVHPRTWMARIARGGQFQTLRATSADQITERIEEALEDWPLAGAIG